MSATSRTEPVPRRMARRPACRSSTSIRSRSNFSTIRTRSTSALREAGPLVYLDKWGVYGVARYAEVHAVLNDPADVLFEPRRGLERFRQGKAVASAKHHPRGGSAGAYPDPRGAEPGTVADGDESGSAIISLLLAAAKVDELLAREVSTRLPISRKPIRCRSFPMRWA